jgi:hypothetical protein
MDLYNALGDGIWQACMLLGRDPSSAIDFGSSIGALLSVLPVERRRGLDYSPDAVANRMIDDIVLTDLDDREQMQAAVNGDSFDLIICQEVAEHLKNIRADSSPQFTMPIIDGLTMAASWYSVQAMLGNRARGISTVGMHGFGSWRWSTMDGYTNIVQQWSTQQTLRRRSRLHGGGTQTAI